MSELVDALPVAAPLPRRRSLALSPAWRDYLTLTKPRIMSLLVLTAVCAMVAGAGGAAGGRAGDARVDGGAASAAAPAGAAPGD